MDLLRSPLFTDINTITPDTPAVEYIMIENTRLEAERLFGITPERSSSPHWNEYKRSSHLKYQGNQTGDPWCIPAAHLPCCGSSPSRNHHKCSGAHAEYGTLETPAESHTCSQSNMSTCPRHHTLQLLPAESGSCALSPCLVFAGVLSGDSFKSPNYHWTCNSNGCSNRANVQIESIPAPESISNARCSWYRMHWRCRHGLVSIHVSCKTWLRRDDAGGYAAAAADGRG